MAPTIGRWTKNSYESWARASGIGADQLSLAWVGQSHPWLGSWQLDRRTEASLTACGVQWLEVPALHNDNWQSPLCAEHRAGDNRWCHAKLYELTQSGKTRLLITSANFSQAAWGAPDSSGGLKIENFELGVVLDGTTGYSRRLAAHDFVRGTYASEFDRQPELPIAWLGASWDGDSLKIECRLSPGVVLEKDARIIVAGKHDAVAKPVSWHKSSTDPLLALSSIPWSDGSGTPLLIKISTSESYERKSAVVDLRVVDTESIVCGEFNREDLQNAMVRLLEDKYGYQSFAEGTNLRTTSGGSTGKSAAGAADYAVPAYVDARRRFRLIDNWATQVGAADDQSRRFVINDGRRICAYWSKASNSIDDTDLKIGAGIAIEELELRLEQLK